MGKLLGTVYRRCRAPHLTPRAGGTKEIGVLCESYRAVAAICSKLLATAAASTSKESRAAC